ncbi:hypothetical protein D3C73_1380970 [compost metagenome]
MGTETNADWRRKVQAGRNLIPSRLENATHRPSIAGGVRGHRVRIFGDASTTIPGDLAKRGSTAPEMTRI